MAIEDIFRALDEQADAEVEEILRVAKLQAKSVGREAQEEADRITAARVASMDATVRARTTKTVNAARLQSKRNLAAVRDEAVDRVFSDAAEKLAGMRGSAEYERVLKALAEEALAGVEGECDLLVAPADAALARKMVDELGATCTISPTLETIGGLAISSRDGRVMRRNTFESRLVKIRGLAQAKVAEVLTS